MECPHFLLLASAWIQRRIVSSMPYHLWQVSETPVFGPNDSASLLSPDRWLSFEWNNLHIY